MCHDTNIHIPSNHDGIGPSNPWHINCQKIGVVEIKRPTVDCLEYRLDMMAKKSSLICLHGGACNNKQNCTVRSYLIEM